MMMAVADPSLLHSNYVLPPDYEIMTETAEVFTKSLLLGMTSEVNNNFSQAEFAEPLPEEFLPYEEAVAYMQKRLPVDRETYYALSDKMRYRAFTVSRLADGDAVRHVQSMIANAMEQGSGMNEFLQMTEGQLADAAGMGKGKGWYYETVYRTNTATAYNVGRAIGFEETPPIALELIGIDDQRQTELCHSLTVPPFRRPYDDPVWDTLWPPFHFNCRTTIRGIYDESEIEDTGGEEKFYSKSNPDYKPAEGFGKYPIDKSDTWWNLTDSMQERAQEYGLINEFEQAKEKLIEETKEEDPIRIKMSQDLESEKEITELGQMIINKANKENKDIIEMLKEYREFGTDQKHTFMKGSNNYAKEEVIEAYQYYPKEWLEKSIEASKDNPLLVKQGKRGQHFTLPDPTIIVGPRPTSAAHEFAHRMEYLKPEIKQIEKEFFERRAAQYGNIEEFLSEIYGNPAWKNEKAMYGNFIIPYMGKIYKHGIYDLLSMGIEGLWFNTYNIKEDPDFCAFIIGILLGV